MSDAIKRRYAAIQAAVAAHLDEGQDYAVREGTTRADVATTIEALRPLGRTARWGVALDVWRGWVLHDETDLRWAIVQGSISAGHAAS